MVSVVANETRSKLPPLPPTTLAVARDRTAAASATGGFLNLRRLDLIATFPSGQRSAPFSYDLVERAALDAVVVVAHFVSEGARHVFLRSSVRPPIALRKEEAAESGNLWELPAGLIDGGESPRAAAARELMEETGLRVAETDLRELGGYTYPAAGVIAERHVFFHVAVDPAARGTPSEDGSPLEHEAAIIAIRLDDALAHCRAGAIRDAKTELGLRRLVEIP